MFKKILILLILTFIIVDFGGKCMAKDVLTKKEQSIVMISAYTAKGDMDNLKVALNKGLDEKLTVNEIKEVLVQLYAYCGFPRSLNGIGTFMGVVKERKNVVEGKAGVPLPASEDKRAFGTKVQTELIGSPATGEYITFAPAIDSYLKEHLFGDIFARGVLTYQEREIATISALSSMDGVEPQLKAHIQLGKNTGLKDEQIEEILKLTSSIPKGGDFGVGEENTAYAKYFIGKSYLNPLTTDGIHSSNVTFEPKCRNNWHIHHKGGQILYVTEGKGYYQEWGKPVQVLKKGDVVNIPAEVKHWHGATKDSWFSHIALAVPAENATTEWLEPVDDEYYSKLEE